MADPSGKPFVFSKKLTKTIACDVLVAGGGIAGTMAAITAARAGASTFLLERYGFLGGIATTWGQICFCGDTAKQGEVFDELLEELQKLNATEPYTPWDPRKVLEFDHAQDWHHSPVARLFDAVVMRAVLAQMVCRQKNLRLRLHSKIIDTVANDGRIEAVVFHDVEGLKAVRPSVVVDCTGDAHLVASCLTCKSGRDGDGAPIPLASRISIRDIGKKVKPIMPAYVKPVDMGMVHLNRNDHGKVSFRNNLTGYDPLDAEQLTAVEVRSQIDSLAITYQLQNKGYPNCVLDSLSTEIGIRMGRRIIGRYVLTAEDVRKGAKFSEAIARGSCNITNAYIDPKTIGPENNPICWEIVPTYQIPFGCLIPQGSRNILTAGRCISADIVALSSARMIPTSAMTGQAAGLAAAHSVQQGKAVGDIDVNALQVKLRTKGAIF